MFGKELRGQEKANPFNLAISLHTAPIRIGSRRENSVHYLPNACDTIQKTYFKANWIILGLLTVVEITPNVLLVARFAVG